MIIQWAAEAGGQWSRTCSLNYLSLFHFVSFSLVVPSLLLHAYTLSLLLQHLSTVLLLCRIKARLGCWKAIYPLARYTTHPWHLLSRMRSYMRYLISSLRNLEMIRYMMGIIVIRT